MSRLIASQSSGRPTNNVYTGLAFVSMAVTLAAMVYLVIRFMDMGIFA